VSRTAEGHFPKVLRAISIAIGNPRIIPKTVTIAAKLYESSKLCQKLAHTPEPVNACTKVGPVAIAWKAGTATNIEGIRIIAKKTNKAMPLREFAALL
jgi:hypothetical protein